MSSAFMVIGVLALAGAIVLCVRLARVTSRAATARSASEHRQNDREQHLNDREQHLNESEQHLNDRERHLTELDQHVAERERRAADREQRLDAELTRLDTRRQDLEDARRQLERDRRELDKDRAAHLRELERIAELTAAQARRELVAVIENQAKREAAVIARDIEHGARRDANKRARGIVAAVIQRVASEQTAESAVTVVRLPDDELKGRIIGREGRNIRAFEAVTGVNVVIDDTPEQVQLSCFDPQRREVARLTLEQLIADGRIHPLRIEEAYGRSRAEAEELTARAAEAALIQLGITDMHPELTSMLGRLRYRTSYGQNVLKHLVEAAHIAGMMASELGLDPVLLRRCTLLHDIGKALTHEVEGSHALIGAEMARRCGEPEDVVHAIAAHHNEVETRTVEAVLTQAADAISGGRPGARREAAHLFTQRLTRIEQIAAARDGVEKVFAMQAGREIRVMVKPDTVDDIQAQVIARDIAKQIEEELTYPGQIRITVVRESRATEFARLHEPAYMSRMGCAPGGAKPMIRP